MDLKITVITLGVSDVAASRKFYENMGFKASSVSNEHIVAFKTPGIVFCLYPRELLAEDASTGPKGEGFRACTLACNVADKNEVAQGLKKAESFGGTIVKQAQDVFWGGHSGYFTDLDGHLWEIAWNPHWPLGVDGLIQLPT